MVENARHARISEDGALYQEVVVTEINQGDRVYLHRPLGGGQVQVTSIKYADLLAQILAAVAAPPTLPLSSNIRLEGNEFSTLNSVPAVLIPTPPAGKMISVILITMQRQYGAARFGDIALALKVIFAGDDLNNDMAAGSLGLQSHNDSFFLSQGIGFGSDATLRGSAVILTMAADIGPWSNIVDSQVNEAGTGYANGDTGQLIQHDGPDTTYVVTSVDGDGAVLTYTLVQGPGNTNATGAVTITGGDQPGAGSGFTLDITVDPASATGAVDLDVLYRLVDIVH